MLAAKNFLARQLKRRGKFAFVHSLARDARVLDAGCGDDSPRRAKALRADLHYIGLDVGDYHQSVAPGLHADSYIIASPEGFAQEIAKFEGQLDAVISSHNLEHCHRPDDVLEAMFKALNRQGRMYLSFPCRESVSFPSRSGALNFYDDPTHRSVPDFDKICASARSRGLRIDFAARRYRPTALMLLGLALEPLGALLGKNMPAGSTWALYGFESVLWLSNSATT